MKYRYLIFLLFILIKGLLAYDTYKIKVGDSIFLDVKKVKKVTLSDKNILKIEKTNNEEEQILVIAKKTGQATISVLYDDGKIKNYKIVVISKLIEDLCDYFKTLKHKEENLNVNCERKKIILSGEINNVDVLKLIKDITSKNKATIIDNTIISVEALKLLAREILEIFKKNNLLNVDLKLLENLRKILVKVYSTDEDIKYIKELINIYTPFIILEIKKVAKANKIVFLEVEFIELKYSNELNFGLAFNKDKIDIYPLDKNLIYSLQLAQRKGLARVLASPKIICSDNQKATFLAGGEIPLKVFSETYSNVIWKDYGIKLIFEPKIINDFLVDINLNIEVSDIDPANAVENIPAVTVRKVSTNITAKTMNTFYVSGLIKNLKGKNVSKIPFLSLVPIIGELFKKRNFIDDKSELIILITPKIYLGEIPELKFNLKKLDEDLKFSIYD